MAIASTVAVEVVLAAVLAGRLRPVSADERPSLVVAG
jgi:hypothetical protein